jgi:hypothetical protein
MDPADAEVPNSLRIGPIASIVSLSCRSAAFEHAKAYADTIARATFGVVWSCDEQEILADYAEGGEPMTGREIEAAWADFDDDRLRGEAESRQEEQRKWEKLASEDPRTAEENDWSNL